MGYQEARNVRREARTLVGRFRGGKLVPVMAVPVRGNEGGLLSQTVSYELDPIAGRMITPITAELTSVFVPVQAIDAIKDPNAAYAGMTEVIREKLLSGNPLFGLETEGEISKRCGVNPRSVGGVKKVNEMVRLAHNAAVNYLRQRKYVDATLLLHSNTSLTPALISQTVLDRFNAVLDPDDRINGAVPFQGQIPVKGISAGNTAGIATHTYKQTDGTVVTGPAWQGNASVGDTWTIAAQAVGSDLPAVYADLGGAVDISLSDFYNAEKMDKLTRAMRKIVDENPEYGEEMVLRWAHGLSVDSGKVPFVISTQKQIFGRAIVGATDTGGVQDDVMRSDMLTQLSFSVPVPRTELGGIIITFASIKPDETISSQPHPYLSDVWGLDNFLADELALDPVPVTIRELDSDCTSAQENTVTCYTGLNALKQTYVAYGFNRHIDTTTVENKTAVWQLEVPLSVTPDTILYPDNLEHYPFADQLAEVCTYVVTSNVVMQTPTIFGPTPVETLAVIDSDNLFEQEV